MTGTGSHYEEIHLTTISIDFPTWYCSYGQSQRQFEEHVYNLEAFSALSRFLKVTSDISVLPQGETIRSFQNRFKIISVVTQSLHFVAQSLHLGKGYTSLHSSEKISHKSQEDRFEYI